MKRIQPNECKLSKTQRKRWKKALEECLQQKSYGAMSTCALCKLVDVNCRICICYKFGAFFEDHDKEIGIACVAYADTNNFTFDDIQKCRNYLCRMLKWLETNQKTKGEKNG